MNVFVTGGSRGIGRAIVEKFAREGHTVILTYCHNRDLAVELTKKYKEVYIYACDVTDDKACMTLAKEVLETFAHIDVLVNNAGIAKDKTFLKMEAGNWSEVIDTNLKSLFYFTQPFVANMVEQGWGRVINISSVIGQKGGFGQTHYAAAKAGVIGFTKALALEVAAKGVTVNAVAPGMIQTDMLKTIPPLYMEQIKDTIPNKTLGAAEDVAFLVYQLAQKESAYITGQVLGINGGMYM